MKWFIGFTLCLAFLTGGAFGGFYYANTENAAKFQDMTGLTVDEFDKAYAGCIIANGELCNLYGGFAPLSKFRDNRSGKSIPQGSML